MSQILIDLSVLQLAIQVPSGWNLIAFTPPSWSLNVLMRDFYVTSQSFTVLSSEPDPISLVSGENWQVLIQLEWAFIENWNFLSDT